jgi:hypothetical protein
VKQAGWQSSVNPLQWYEVMNQERNTNLNDLEKTIGCPLNVLCDHMLVCNKVLVNALAYCMLVCVWNFNFHTKQEKLQPA